MTWSPAPTRKHIECTPLDTRGPKRLWDAPAGVVQRHRGDTGRLVKHDYLCPMHGRFEMEVPASDVPDAVLCPAVEPWADAPGRRAAPRVEWKRCNASAPWSPSTFGIWASAGEVKS